MHTERFTIHIKFVTDASFVESRLALQQLDRVFSM